METLCKILHRVAARDLAAKQVGVSHQMIEEAETAQESLQHFPG